MAHINSTERTESNLIVCFECDSPVFGSIYESKIGTETYFFKITRIINGHHVTAQEVGGRYYLRSKKSGADLMGNLIEEVKTKGKIRKINQMSQMI